MDNPSVRILLAEDNAINQKIVAHLLAPLNYTLDIVNNGLEAVAAVTRSPYDLVLIDIQMPEIDGVMATAKIRSLPGPVCDIPIIAMTANAMQGNREKYLGAVMKYYVAKPIDQRALLRAIARWANAERSVLGVTLQDEGPTNSEATTQDATKDTADDFNDLIGNFDKLRVGTGR
jgi:CheY-like chemotaxis protein